MCLPSFAVPASPANETLDGNCAGAGPAFQNAPPHCSELVKRDMPWLCSCADNWVASKLGRKSGA